MIRLLFSLCLIPFVTLLGQPSNGQVELRIFGPGGYTPYPITWANGQVIVKSGGVPVAITLDKAAVGLGNLTNAAQLTVANNLSDLSNATDARTNLGLVIGTHVQPWNSRLDDVAALGNAPGVLTNDGDGVLTWTVTGPGEGQIPRVTSGVLAINGIFRASSGISTSELGVDYIFFSNVQESGFWAVIQASTLSGNRTLTLPDSTGTLITTGDSGSVTNTMLAGSIGNAKLANSSVTIFGSTLALGGSLASLPAVKLGTATDPDTINPSEVGIGWADDKFTIQTAAGALQLYLTGDPEEATLYWPGRITADSFEAASLSASINGSQVDHGSIPGAVMLSSMTAPAREWQDGANFAGVNGLTYANTGPSSQSEPTTPGTYFAAIEVTDGGTDFRNAIVGRVRTAAQMNVPVIVSAPASASSTGTAGQIAYDSSYLYICTATNTWKRVAIASW